LPDDLIKEIVGYSRSTYYRAKKLLPPSNTPKHRNKPQWGEADIQRVLRIRRENPTYGKDKIGVILRRDHGSTLSNSSVGRIKSPFLMPTFHLQIVLDFDTEDMIAVLSWQFTYLT
jgi:hypothetical protein